jgi:hypothetical protein
MSALTFHSNPKPGETTYYRSLVLEFFLAEMNSFLKRKKMKMQEENSICCRSRKSV